MSKTTCDGCGRPIKANTAMLLMNTETTTQRWHLACLIREQAPASQTEKDWAAA